MPPLPPIETATGYDRYCRRVIGVTPAAMAAGLILSFGYHIVPQALKPWTAGLCVAVAVLMVCMAFSVVPRARALTMSSEELGFSNLRDALRWNRSPGGVPPFWTMASVVMLLALATQMFFRIAVLWSFLPLFAGLGLASAISSVLRSWPIDALEKKTDR